MRLQQLNRRSRTHLRRDNRRQVILHIQRVDSGLCAVAVIADLQRPLKELVFPSVPMKPDPNAHIMQQHAFRSSFPPYLRCCQYPYADVHFLFIAILAFNSQVLMRSL